MRIDTDALLFKALVALDEIADAAGAEPIPQTFAVRFALAWLYAVSDGNRAPYDAFFRLLGDPLAWANCRTQAAYSRETHLRTHLHAIARSVGWCDATPQFQAALDRARLPKGERLRLLAEERARASALEAIKRHQEEQRALDPRKREGRDCGFGLER